MNMASIASGVGLDTSILEAAAAAALACSSTSLETRAPTFTYGLASDTNKTPSLNAPRHAFRDGGSGAAADVPCALPPPPPPPNTPHFFAPAVGHTNFASPPHNTCNAPRNTCIRCVLYCI